MKICLILEGCYPYVFGGVSTWMHQYINNMKEHEFILWVIGANAKRSLNELETAGLIMRVRQGIGEPNRIYVLIPGKEDAALA